jgi:hypothetical protein
MSALHPKTDIAEHEQAFLRGGSNLQVRGHRQNVRADSGEATGAFP